MARIDIKHLEAFVHVADQSSFRGAAATLNTTQPNISARIAALETRIGQKLMDRDAGSVRLTPAGILLLAKARGVIDALDDFMVTAGAQGLFEDTLRLGVTEMIAHSWIGTYLSALRDRFPNVRVDLTVDLSTTLSDALFDRSLDLALQNGPFNRQTSGGIELGGYPHVWVASGALGIGRDALSASDMMRHPIITHARRTQSFQQIEKHLAGERQARLVPSTSLSTCLRMTVEGLGIACLPHAMVAEDIEMGRLMRLRYPWVPDDLVFMARFHAESASYFLHQAACLAREIAIGEDTSGSD